MIPDTTQKMLQFGIKLENTLIFDRGVIPY